MYTIMLFKRTTLLLIDINEKNFLSSKPPNSLLFLSLKILLQYEFDPSYHTFKLKDRNIYD